MQISITTLALLLVGVSGHDHPRCTSKAPSQAELERQEMKIQALKRHRRGITCKQCIPVDTYVTLFHCSDGDGTWVDQAKVNEQMDVVNDSFRDSPFKFKLLDTFFVVDDLHCQAFGDTSALGRKYRQGDYSTLNMYIGGPEDGSFAYFPTDGGADENPYDGAFVDINTLPGGPPGCCNLGLTATHEIGHWLGLEHTFGMSDNPCDPNEKGDFVDDTPAAEFTDFNCPIGKNSCPNLPGVDPIHNYMDYSNDACYEEFTRGQMDRMYWVWSLYRKDNEACTGQTKKFEFEIRGDQSVSDGTYFSLESTDGTFMWTLDDDVNGVDFVIRPNELKTFDLCIQSNKDYVFTIHDRNSNGLFAPGYYTLRYNGQTIRQPTSNFGASQATSFGGADISPAQPSAPPTPVSVTPAPNTPSPITPAPIDAFTGDCENSPPDWHDSDGPEYDCAWYALDDNCAEYGDEFANPNFGGKTAKNACCVCLGGRDTGGGLSPVAPPVSPPMSSPVASPVVASGTCQSTPNWHDSDGTEYTCAWYSFDNNCQDFGSDFEFNGETATDACCECGGGSSGDGGGSTGTACSDSPPNWHDSDGPDFDCSWYTIGDRCGDFGDQFPNFGGKTAQEACCACGGGN